MEWKSLTVVYYYNGLSEVKARTSRIKLHVWWLNKNNWKEIFCQNGHKVTTSTKRAYEANFIDMIDYTFAHCTTYLCPCNDDEASDAVINLQCAILCLHTKSALLWILTLSYPLWSLAQYDVIETPTKCPILHMACCVLNASSSHQSVYSQNASVVQGEEVCLEGY